MAVHINVYFNGLLLCRENYSTTLG